MYDVRLEMPGWDNAGFNASAWLSVNTGSVLTSGSTPVLQAYPTEHVQ